ncbi:biotin/lipoyl-containing protein, partial [uncultured Akkermansia sp.]|uniref:biotin/lipoyl-containing protein n=1 Tax=uncultured Akkermansia sp. TaxID=512294 RepID=UPI0025E562B2
MATTIEMPRLSDSMHEGIVLRWIKKTGDFVEVGDHLADIETDKAHVELQACEDGTLAEILVPEGGSAAVGAPIALLQSEFGAAAYGCPPCPPVTCSPLAARLAAEAGLN